MTSRKREPLRWRCLHRSVDATPDAAPHTPNHRKSVKVWNCPQKHHRNSQLKKTTTHDHVSSNLCWCNTTHQFRTATFVSSAFVSVCVSCKLNLTPSEASTQAQNINLIHLLTHVPPTEKKNEIKSEPVPCSAAFCFVSSMRCSSLWRASCSCLSSFSASYFIPGNKEVSAQDCQ